MLCFGAGFGAGVCRFFQQGNRDRFPEKKQDSDSKGATLLTLEFGLWFSYSDDSLNVSSSIQKQPIKRIK